MAQVTIVLDTHQDDDAAMLRRLMGDYEQQDERAHRDTEVVVNNAPAAPEPEPTPETPAAPAAPAQSEPETPAQPEQPAAPADPGVDVDADGRPWDSRIDSSSGKKNQGDGRWAKRKNVDAEYRKQVIAELQAQSGGGYQPEPEPEQPPQQDPAATFGTTEPTAGDHTIPEPPKAPEGTTGTEHDNVDFPSFMQRLTSALQNNLIDQQTVHSEMLTANGLTAMPQLAQNPALLPQVSRRLEELTGA